MFGLENVADAARAAALIKEASAPVRCPQEIILTTLPPPRTHTRVAIPDVRVKSDEAAGPLPMIDVRRFSEAQPCLAAVLVILSRIIAREAREPRGGRAGLIWRMAGQTSAGDLNCYFRI